MKKLMTMAVGAMMIASCTATKKVEAEKTQAEQLFERLDTLRQKGYMFGHQDDPFYGLTWDYQPDSSDVKNTCGDWPAVMGFELGGIEMGDQKNLDSVPFTKMRDEIIKHYERGGVVTISWHPRNPMTTIEGGGLAGQKFPEGTAWDVTDTTVVKNILEGGKKHELFKTWMQRVSDFLAQLKTADGKKVPIIFRPWHENTGSWFWWGENLCTDEDYRALWRMTYDYIAVERGLDNYLWAYSPSSTDLAKAMDRYPGDDIVGLIGVDHYDSYGDDEVHGDFIRDMRRCLEYLSGVARQHGLLLAVTETGQESIPCPTWWTEVLQPSVEGFPVSYVLTWRNASDRPSHFFGPWKGAACEKDFLDFHDSDKTLFLKDLD